MPRFVSGFTIVRYSMWTNSVFFLLCVFVYVCVSVCILYFIWGTVLMCIKCKFPQKFIDLLFGFVFFFLNKTQFSKSTTYDEVKFSCFPICFCFSFAASLWQKYTFKTLWFMLNWIEKTTTQCHNFLFIWYLFLCLIGLTNFDLNFMKFFLLENTIQLTNQCEKHWEQKKRSKQSQISWLWSYTFDCKTILAQLFGLKKIMHRKNCTELKIVS